MSLRPSVTEGACLPAWDWENKTYGTYASYKTYETNQGPVLEEKINAVKRLAVSTGQLRRLLALHTRPIDLVVFQEPSHRSAGDLVLRRVSRLYAFSVYPGRT